MTQDYGNTRSRLRKIEDKNNVRQALLFAFLTIVLVVLMAIFGVPGLTKLAIFLGDLKSSQNIEDDRERPVIIQSPSFSLPYEATSSAIIHISGYAMSDAKVKLLVNGSPYTANTDLTGNFTFKNIELAEGENKIYALTIVGSDESNPSATQTIYQDSKPPELVIESPTDGQSFFDFERDIVVRGQSEPETTVSVNGRLVIVNNDGSFSSNLHLSEGENKIEVKSVDRAQNQTDRRLTVKYYP